MREKLGEVSYRDDVDILGDRVAIWTRSDDVHMVEMEVVDRVPDRWGHAGRVGAFDFDTDPLTTLLEVQVDFRTALRSQK